MDRAVVVAVKVGMFSLVVIFSSEKLTDLETVTRNVSFWFT